MCSRTALAVFISLVSRAKSLFTSLKSLFTSLKSLFTRLKFLLAAVPSRAGRKKKLGPYRSFILQKCVLLQS